MDRHSLEMRTISNESLERLLKRFQPQVRSVRRMENVKSIRDLLDLLERQDLLDADILEEIRNYVGSDVSLPVSRPYLQEIPLQQMDRMEIIHNLIAKKIGRSWKEFARRLDVNENEIDAYDIQFNKDSRKITLEVLFRFKQNIFHNKHEWYSELRQALVYAKRNDIWEAVEDKVVHFGGIEQLNL